MGVHKIKIRDGLQVVAGSAFPVLLIFSTVTIVPPSIWLGIGILIFTMFLSFLALAGIFRTQRVRTILSHVLIGFLVAFGISIIFLYLWTGMPFEEILSMNFFITEGLVATCVGLFTGALVDARRG